MSGKYLYRNIFQNLGKYWNFGEYFEGPAGPASKGRYKVSGFEEKTDDSQIFLFGFAAGHGYFAFAWLGGGEGGRGGPVLIEKIYKYEIYTRYD